MATNILKCQVILVQVSMKIKGFNIYGTKGDSTGTGKVAKEEKKCIIEFDQVEKPKSRATSQSCSQRRVGTDVVQVGNYCKRNNAVLSFYL